jgi:predicted O-methyltransferase YrrM
MTQGFLPEFNDVSRANRHGRNPFEGYQRGAGLKFRGLADKVVAEPDFQDAYALAQSRSVVAPMRLINLYLLIRFYMPRLEHGHIIEFGSYRAGSAMMMARLAARYLPGARVYALDTYSGMPVTDKAIDGHNVGDFADTNYEEILAAKDAAGLDNLHLVRGLFADTTPGVLAECRTIALAHIDCDIYHPACDAWRSVKPVMIPGGYVVFDDATEATCLGATEAVEDIISQENLRCEQIDPHFVFRYPPLPSD